MESVFIMLVGIIFIVIGYLLMGRLYNHLTIYSIMWTLSLFLYSLKLLRYNNIELKAWVIIFLAWFTLYLGSVTIIFINKLHNRNINKSNEDRGKFNGYSITLLKKFLILTIILSCISLLSRWLTLLKMFGSVELVIKNANKVYNYRIARDLIIGIPYIGSFTLVSCTLGGLYTGLKRKFTFLGIIPLIITVLNDIAVMGRAITIIGIILYVTSVIFSDNKSRSGNFINKTNIKMFILISLVFLGSLFFIGFNRGVRSYYVSESASMNELREFVSFAPAIYTYISASPVAFNEYLKSGGENLPIGAYTFKPIFNFIFKMNKLKYSYYQKFYYTPEPVNTATYLRDIYEDFGIVGVILIPYILGVLITYLYFFGLKKKNKYFTTRILISNLFVIMVMSIWYITTYLGDFFINFIISFLISLFIDYYVKTNTEKITSYYTANAIHNDEI